MPDTRNTLYYGDNLTILRRYIQGIGTGRANRRGAVGLGCLRRVMSYSRLIAALSRKVCSVNHGMG
jgi:hypothetical protein